MTETPQQLPVEIRQRWTDKVLYTSTTAKHKGEALIEAVAAKIDLSQADLFQVELPYGARLVGARLVGARLDGARLDGARLDGASLVGASLVGARLDGASLVGARLDGARLDGARLDGASLDGASLVGARLDGASLVGASLVGARLDGARLDGASLDGASLDGGVKVARGSRAAYAGPVGDSSRTVYGFIAQPDENHPKPWLVLVCGCFTGDEKAYRERIGKYEKTSAEHKQCLAALAHCKAIAKTWAIEVEKPQKAAKAAKAGGQ